MKSGYEGEEVKGDERGYEGEFLMRSNLVATFQPMTLGNMRANGVRSLAVWCGGPDCFRKTVLDVTGYADDLPVPAFGPRLRCEVCGHLGADARPNWSETSVGLR